jgi:FixJ family two-component response regulator
VGGDQEMVFVVDDEPSVRKSLGRLLQTSGYQTETFPSVIDFLNREHYDGVGCLVLDVYLRGLSGVDAIARLQEMNYDLPVVFITGYQDTQLRHRDEKGCCGLPCQASRRG